MVPLERKSHSGRYVDIFIHILTYSDIFKYKQTYSQAFSEPSVIPVYLRASVYSVPEVY